MATNQYGIDFNGNPTGGADKGGESVLGNTVQCPQGQMYDFSAGGCVPAAQTQTNTTQPQDRTTTPPAPTTNTNPTNPTGNRMDSNYILNQIKQWAGMPQADPSLTNDPNYWLTRITQTGGLGQDNLDYWTRAATGPTAFYLNPNRESGGGGVGGFLSGAAPGAYQIQPYKGPAPDFQGFQGSTIPTYNPFQFTPVGNFNVPASQGQAGDVISFLLNNTSLSPDVVAKMKEGQKSTMQTMADQLNQNMLQSAASRGTLGSGTTQANIAAGNQDLIGKVSDAYRNIDIQKAVQDQTDRLNAVAASNAYANQLFQQFLGAGQLKLGQETAQAGEQFKGYQSKADAEKQQYQQYLDQEKMREQQQSAAFAEWLSSQGLGLQENQNAFLQWLQGNNMNLDVAKWLAS